MLECVKWMLRLAALLVVVMTSGSAAAAEKKLEVLFFWGENCPFCEMQKPYMKELAQKYPEVVVRDFETYRNRDNQALYAETLKKYQATSRGIPMTFIGERYWVGFQKHFYPEMIAEVEKILGIAEPHQEAPAPPEAIRIPLLGYVDAGAMPLFLATALISFVDGFNPCSLWLLTVLLGILIHTRSRKKTVIVGLVFLGTTTAGYGVLMLGLFNVFMYIGYMDWIKIAVGLVALVFAVVNIKDYFWFQEGVSFTISDKHKPGIFKRMRDIINPNMSTSGMVGATVIMALGLTLVEFPCTAGFPVVWTKIVAAHNIGGLEFALLLAVYLLIYLLDEIVIMTIAVVTLKRSVFEEKHGRILKLIGGVIMLSLAYGIVFDYKALESIAGVLRLFGIATLIIVVVLLLHRVALPRLGIALGSEKIETPAKRVKKKSDKK